MSVSARRVGTRRTPTDQQLLQQTLLGEAVEAASFAVVVFDEDRNCVAVNAAACALTGYTRQELLDLDVVALAVRPERAERRLREVARGKRSAGREIVRRKDGTTVPVSYQVAETQLAGATFFISICRGAS